MSKGQTKKTREAAGNRRKLTRAEKKQIAEAIRKAKGDGKARTAQQTIPYLAMYPDGICKVTEKRYSKCVVFEDINYQLAQADDKTAIFENWCDFLNYFDASVSVQLSFINQGTQREQAEKAITIPAQEDAFNSIRTEYSDMLKNQLAKLKFTGDDYFMTSDTEFFAEAFAEYCKNGNRLKESCEAVYTYIDNALNAFSNLYQ